MTFERGGEEERRRFLIRGCGSTERGVRNHVDLGVCQIRNNKIG